MLISYKADVSYANLFKEVLNQTRTKAAYQIRYLNAIDNILQMTDRRSMVLVKMSLSGDIYKNG
jgi:hypothetical protein